MFSQNGLSLDQAPPIGVVFRFFLIGSAWGMVAGALLLAAGESLWNPSAPVTLMMVHAWTLGVWMSFMIGALFQMLPVLAGVAFAAPVPMAIRTQYPMLVGTLLLVVAFGHPSPILFGLGAVLLLVGLAPALIIMVMRLYRVATHTPASRGITYAVFHALITLLLGAMLVGMRLGWWSADPYLPLRTAHIGYGLLGWVALLILSVALQVVEMFYVTPPYPSRLTRWLPLSIAAVLVGALIAGRFSLPLQQGLHLLALGGLVLWGAITLRRFSQRKRPLTDATVWLWRLGSLLLVVAMVGVAVSIVATPPETVWRLGAVAFVGFVTSILLAMSYKIVPFLTWFHLNAQGYYNAPMMHEVIHPRYALRHLWIHLAALASLTLGIFVPQLLPIAGGLFVLSFGWLFVAIYRAWHLYRAIQATGERFEMPRV